MSSLNSTTPEKNTFPKLRSPLRVTLQLAILYGALGIAWILVSDHVLSSWVADPDTLTRYQSLKGTIYVFVTSAVFCLLLRHELVKRHNYQTRLLESDEKFRQLANNLNSVLWISNPEKNRIIYVSPGYERVWGRSCDEVYVSAACWLEAIVPEDRERVRNAALTKQDAGLYDEEYRIARPDGSIRWVRDRAFPARNEAGDIYWIVGIAEDISEKKAAQDALVAANRIKSDFLNVMSHELRTPLNVITGYVSLFLEGTLGTITQEQVAALGKVERQAQELLLMINRILDVTRIEGDAVLLYEQDMDLAKFIDEIKSDYGLPLGKEVVIVWDYPESLPAIHSDSGKLKSILQNLINNAIKFTEQGTITVACRHSSRLGQVEFTVRDTGIGIAGDKLPRVFELFWQADSSERRPYGGVGVGLYIVKSFTEMLGGQVTVQSEMGKGTVFTVVIPDGLSTR